MTRSSRYKKPEVEFNPLHLEAVRLRTLGWTYPDIAEELKVSVNTATQWVKRAYQRYMKQMNSSVEELIVFQEAQIDWSIKKITSSIEESPFGEGLARKLEVLVKLMDRKAALRGLDAPKKTQNVNTNVNFSNLSIEELRAEAEKLGIKTTPLPEFSNLLPGEGPEGRLALPSPVTVESLPEG